MDSKVIGKLAIIFALLVLLVFGLYHSSSFVMDIVINEAARGDHLYIIRIFHSLGAEIDRTSGDNLQTMHIAARGGSPAVVEYLLEHEKNAGYGKGMTPLIWAAGEGHADVVAKLALAGADMEARIRRFRMTGCTALHLATARGHSEVVKTLALYGADMNARSRGDYMPGATALHMAVENRDKDTVKELMYQIERGVEVNLEDDEGRTPLELAQEKVHDEIADILEKHGAE